MWGGFFIKRYEHGGDVYGDDGISLDFSININPFGMQESVKRAIVEHIPEYVRYPDPDCRELRGALSELYDLKMSNVICGNGASELIFALCAAIKPRNALIPAPTFSEYEQAAELYDCKVRKHFLAEADGFGLTERILDDLDPDLDLLFLCTPNNPTGNLIGVPLLEKIAEVCLQNGTLFLLDECFIDFTGGESMMGKLPKYPNLLILRAFTKIYAMAGLRLGMMYCADEKLLARIADFCPTWSVSGVAQAAGVAALGEEGWIEKTRDLVENEREFMAAALTGLGLTVYKSSANFLLIRSGGALHGPLRERGILVRSCANFTGLDERYIRVGIKTHEENLVLLHAMEEILG